MRTDRYKRNKGAVRTVRAVAAAVCAVLVICMTLGMCHISADAATRYTSDDKNWYCWFDTSSGYCTIKPAKSGVSGVSKGTVKIPATVKVKSKSYKVNVIGSSAFSGNTAITSVSFASATNLTTIRASAFKGCTSLKTVTGLSKTKLSAIGDSAFEGDTKLVGESSTAGLVLPSTLKTVRQKVFYKCSSIKLVNGKSASAIATIESNAFKSINSGATIYAYNAAKYTLFKNSGVTGTLIAYNYVITYNRNGVSGTAFTQNCTYGSTVTLRAANTYSRTGYTLGSWNANAQGTGKNYSCGGKVSNLTANGAVTLYANWKANTYKVQYNANGGSGTTAAQTLTYDKAANLTANGFKRTGYTFAGWATSASGKAVYANKASVKNLTSANGGTVTMYAVWTPITYKVQYNANGGSGTTAAQTLTYDKAANLTANGFTRTGYTFTGWATSASGKSAYANKASVKNLTSSNGGTVTLYAVWVNNAYTISFAANAPEATSATGTQDNIICKFDEEKTLGLCRYSCTGYKFKEWNTAADGSGTGYAEQGKVRNLTDVNGETVTLYAIWEPITYTIKFNKGQNGAGTVPASIQCVYGQPIVIPEYDSSTLYRRGWVFQDWCTDSNGTANSDSSNVFEAGKTYNVNLSSEDGSEVVLYGRWMRVKYTIKYVTGTSEKISDTSFTCEAGSVMLPQPDESRKKGYSFDSWYSGANGTGEKFDFDSFRPKAKYSLIDKVSVSNGSDSTASTITLYANWKPNTYTVYLDGQNAASRVPESIVVTYGGKYSSLPTPSRTGYNFLGWSTQSTGGSYVKNTDTVKITDAQALYAVWKAKTYKVTYDAQGGRYSGRSRFSVTYTYGKELAEGFKGNLLPTPTRTGYNFKYWYYYKTVNGKKTLTKLSENSAIAVKENMTIYAKWEKQSFTLKSTKLVSRGNSYSATIKWKTNYPNVKSYQIAYSYKKGKLSKAKYVKITPKKTKGVSNISLRGLAKGKQLWVKLRVTYKENGKAKSKTFVIYDISSSKVSVTMKAGKGKMTVGSKKLSSCRVSVVKKAGLATGFADGKSYVPTRKGYKFAGWYTKPNGKGRKITGSYKFTKKTTIYAKWKKIR